MFSRAAGEDRTLEEKSHSVADGEGRKVRLSVWGHPDSSEHPRWSSSCYYNAARNDPYAESPVPAKHLFAKSLTQRSSKVGLRRFAE